MDSDQLNIYYPVDPLLRQCIEYFYFLRTDTNDFSSTYYSFPNTVYSLNIHKNASCVINGHSVTTKHDPANHHLCIMQGKYNNPIKVRLEGRLDKVTIGFKPLGLNNLINTSLADVAAKPVQVFNHWDNQPAFHQFLNTFYQTSDYTKKIAALETFLLSQYKPVAALNTLKNAIELLSNFEQEITVAEIARSLMMTERSLNRLFHKHLATSPTVYRQIARFRHSLKNKLIGEVGTSLTQIGYKSNFYDQSYFVKVYRKLAGDHPSAFFNTINRIADDRLIFKFV